jgi:hypothetical protein
MSEPITTLVLATGSAFLSKFAGPAAEILGRLAFERAQQVGAKATAYLTAVNREPRPIEPKVLFPLVEGAALETDDSLADKWAALLANAADPGADLEITPGFGDILRQLTPRHAGLLDKLFDIASHIQSRYPEEVQPREKLDREATLRSNVNLRSIYARATTSHSSKTRISDNETQHQFEAAIDNFLRLGLITLAVMPPEKLKPLFVAVTKPTKESVFFTSLGYDFMLACMPPTTRNA